MSVLSWLSIGLGGVLLLVYVPAWMQPDKARRAWLAFPRSRPSGLILAALALLMAGVSLYHMPLGGFEDKKVTLFALMPIAYVLIIIFVDELLAVRALAALLLLLPTPILNHARWHPSPWRYVLIVTAYVMVLKGMVLVLKPYLYRRWIEKYLGTNEAWCTFCSCAVTFAGLLVFLGLTLLRLE